MKIIYLIFFILFLGCNLNNKEELHGISGLKIKLNELNVSSSNQNDVIKIFGSPIIMDAYDKNIWTYYEVRKKTNLLGTKKLILNDVVIFKFNKFGLLTDMQFYDMNSLNEIVFSDKKTTPKGLDESTLQTLLSSTKKRWELSRDRLSKSKNNPSN